MNTRIVVPLDGSDLAIQSLPFALKLARLCQGELYLLEVVAEVKENFLYDWSHRSPLHKKEEAEQYLAKIVRKLTLEGNDPLPADRVFTVVVEGHHPAQRIVREAQELGATHIFMTTNGLGGLSQLVVGSTALEILRHTALPVILMRPQHPEPKRDGQTEKKAKPYLEEELAGPVVVTLDGSPEAEVALKPAFELAGQLGLPVSLLRVLPHFVPVDQLTPWYEANLDRGMGTDYLPEHDFDYLRKLALDYLENIKIVMRKQKVIYCQAALKVGEPVDEIIKYTEAVNASVVVMATHPHGRLEQAFLGTIAGRVLNKEHLPVMLVNTGFREN